MWDYILDAIASAYSKKSLFFIIMGVLFSYRYVYIVIGFLVRRRKYPETDQLKKYAVVIPARNEEIVIPGLIDSIFKQNYPIDLLTVFVVADNCTDQTAAVARKAGAIVYERFDSTKKRKGWALEYLFEQIDKDYKIESFDAFLFFDADNLLDQNFVKEMNKAMAKHRIVTGYRDTKNFEDSFIASSYGIHYYRDAMAYHRPRQALGIGTHITGTGFAIASDLLKDGWHCFDLIEDIEFSFEMALKNVKIGFCEDAIYYDEQPTDLNVSFKQRIRWSRGGLNLFTRYWYKMIGGMFRYASFTLYDFFLFVLPWNLFMFAFLFIYPFIFSGVTNIGVIITGPFLVGYLKRIALYFLGVYVNNFIQSIFVLIREHKHIKTPFKRTVLAAIIFPWFYMVTMFINIKALFQPNLQWVEIKHTDARSIHEVRGKK